MPVMNGPNELQTKRRSNPCKKSNCGVVFWKRTYESSTKKKFARDVGPDGCVITNWGPNLFLEFSWRLRKAPLRLTECECYTHQKINTGTKPNIREILTNHDKPTFHETHIHIIISQAVTGHVSSSIARIEVQQPKTWTISKAAEIPEYRRQAWSFLAGPNAALRMGSAVGFPRFFHWENTQIRRNLFKAKSKR